MRQHPGSGRGDGHRVLRLKYAPSPGNAARFAADIVKSAASVDGVTLDYSPESLEIIDDIMDRFRAEGVPSQAIAETLFSFGCYVGEVINRNAGGRWRDTAPGETDTFGFPIVVELSGQRLCNPIGKVFKRVDNGPAESLRYFYSVFTAST